jgi:molybdopterin converting factor small subunit
MTPAVPAVRVQLPAALRPLAADRAETAVRARTVGEALRALAAAHPALAPRLLDREGRLLRYVNLFLDEEDVRHLGGLDAAVRDGAVLLIVPAIAGGSSCP